MPCHENDCTSHDSIHYVHHPMNKFATHEYGDAFQTPCHENDYRLHECINCVHRMHTIHKNALGVSHDALNLHYDIHNNKPIMMDDMFLYRASHLFEHWIFCANRHKHVRIMMDDVYIYHAHTIFSLSLFRVGTHVYSSTSQSQELTKRALEGNDVWDPVDYPYHRSIRARTTRISSTWLSHGYGPFTTCHLMPILSCSLCMLYLFLCLCHAIVTLACIYP